MRRVMMAAVALLLTAGPVLADEAADLRDENKTLRLKNAELLAHNNELKAENVVLQAEADRLRQRVAALQAELAKLKPDSIAIGPPPVRPRDNSTPRVDTPRVNTPDTNTPRVDTPRVTLLPDRSPSGNLIPDVPDVIIPDAAPRTRATGPRIDGLPTNVGVVDMVEVFNALKEKDRIEQGLADLIYAVQFEDQKWRRRINDYLLDLRTLKPGTLDFEQKQAQIERAQIDWQVALQQARNKLDRRRGELTGKLYQKMVIAVGRIADSNGYDMVVFKEPDTNYSGYSSMEEFLASRLVIRANQSVDLTEQVIRMMNREYENQLSRGN